jgi:hypothetical protein
VPLQQLDAELTFQGQDCLRQGGLAQVQLTGGRGQAAFLGDGDEHPQFAYLHYLIAP